jgi:hypothetical protein
VSYFYFPQPPPPGVLIITLSPHFAVMLSIPFNFAFFPEALENAYTFIINPQSAGGGDILLYSDETYNISNLVLKKLGVTPAPAATNTTVPPVKKN